ncbi:MAG: ATP-binding protein [Alphaproteobacteria bacterium]|jgi:PAS domain S-box-containing protein|nr:PAS domain-containing protein [Thalassospira sp.]MCE2965477.1 ATP-binding protein [Alphaproteobacteria bacterium]
MQNADKEADLLFDAISTSNLAHTMSALDGDKELTYVNQAFLDETGYTRDEVIGRNCRFLQGKDTDPQSVEKIRQALATFKPIDIEILNYRKDGTPFLNRLKISTVFDKAGKPLAFMGIQSNVSSLVEIVRMAQERYRMESLGRLSANVSHEIKNALQPVRLMLENLGDIDTLPAEIAKKSIAIAMENLVLAENIVHDVLRYSKNSLSDKEVIPAFELAEHVVRFSKNLLPHKAELVVAIDDTLRSRKDALLKVHQNGVYQMATNLISNALDATKKTGRIKFFASIERFKETNTSKLKAGEYLALSVEDNGDGIPDSVIGNIFQPFYSTKSPSEGTGLGLAISMKVAKDHGGTITAENIAGSGAKFTLYLPID